MAKDKKLDIQQQKNFHEQENIAIELELKKADQLLRVQLHQEEMKQRTLDKKEETRCQVMQTCIQQEKTPEEIRAILDFL